MPDSDPYSGHDRDPVSPQEQARRDEKCERDKSEHEAMKRKYPGGPGKLYWWEWG